MPLFGIKKEPEQTAPRPSSSGIRKPSGVTSAQTRQMIEDRATQPGGSSSSKSPGWISWQDYNKYEQDYDTWTKTGKHGADFDSWSTQSGLDAWRSIRDRQRNGTQAALIGDRYYTMDKDTYSRYEKDYKYWQKHKTHTADFDSWATEDGLENWKRIRDYNIGVKNGTNPSMELQGTINGLDQDVLSLMAEQYRASWKYGTTDEDMARKAAGQPPKSKDKYYKNGTEFDRWLYSQGLPSTKDDYFGRMYEAAAQEVAARRQAEAAGASTKSTGISGKSIPADQAKAISDAFRSDWTYANSSEDKARKRGGRMPKSLEALYTDSDEDRWLFANGLPPSVLLNDYMGIMAGNPETPVATAATTKDGKKSKDAASLSTYHIDFTGREGIQAEIAEQWKRDWKYADTTEDRARQRTGRMPAKLEALYTDTEADRWYKRNGLPPASMISLYLPNADMASLVSDPMRAVREGGQSPDSMPTGWRGDPGFAMETPEGQFAGDPGFTKNVPESTFAGDPGFTKDLPDRRRTAPIQVPGMTQEEVNDAYQFAEGMKDSGYDRWVLETQGVPDEILDVVYGSENKADTPQQSQDLVGAVLGQEQKPQAGPMSEEDMAVLHEIGQLNGQDSLPEGAAYDAGEANEVGELIAALQGERAQLSREEQMFLDQQIEQLEHEFEHNQRVGKQRLTPKARELWIDARTRQLIPKMEQQLIASKRYAEQNDVRVLMQDEGWQPLVENAVKRMVTRGWNREDFEEDGWTSPLEQAVLDYVFPDTAASPEDIKIDPEYVEQRAREKAEEEMEIRERAKAFQGDPFEGVSDEELEAIRQRYKRADTGLAYARRKDHDEDPELLKKLQAAGEDDDDVRAAATLYSRIHGAGSFFEDMGMQQMRRKPGSGKTGNEYTVSSCMTQQEMDMFDRLVAMDPAQAMKYYHDLEPKLNARWRRITEARAEDDNIWWGTFKTIAHEFAGYGAAEGALALMKTGLANAGIGEGIKPDDPNFTYGYYDSAVIGGNAEKIRKEHGAFWGWLYENGVSVVKNWVRNMTYGEMGLLMMGLDVAGKQINDVIDKGGNQAQALALGVIGGFAEYITEQYSLESLLNMKSNGTLKGFFRSMFNQMLAEGSEELGSYCINTLADAFIMGDDSHIAELYQQHLQENGGDARAALRSTLIDVAWEGGKDALGGAFSGGVMAGPTMIINTYKYGKEHGVKGGPIATIKAGAKAVQLYEQAKSEGTVISGKVATEISVDMMRIGMNDVDAQNINGLLTTVAQQPEGWVSEGMKGAVDNLQKVAKEQRLQMDADNAHRQQLEREARSRLNKLFGNVSEIQAEAHAALESKDLVKHAELMKKMNTALQDYHDAFSGARAEWTTREAQQAVKENERQQKVKEAAAGVEAEVDASADVQAALVEQANAEEASAGNASAASDQQAMPVSRPLARKHIQALMEADRAAGGTMTEEQALADYDALMQEYLDALHEKYDEEGPRRKRKRAQRRVEQIRTEFENRYGEQINPDVVDEFIDRNLDTGAASTEQDNAALEQQENAGAPVAEEQAPAVLDDATRQRMDSAQDRYDQFKKARDEAAEEGDVRSVERAESMMQDIADSYANEFGMTPGEAARMLNNGQASSAYAQTNNSTGKETVNNGQQQNALSGTGVVNIVPAGNQESAAAGQAKQAGVKARTASYRRVQAGQESEHFRDDVREAADAWGGVARGSGITADDFVQVTPTNAIKSIFGGLMRPGRPVPSFYAMKDGMPAAFTQNGRVYVGLTGDADADAYNAPFQYGHEVSEANAGLRAIGNNVLKGLISSGKMTEQEVRDLIDVYFDTKNDISGGTLRWRGYSTEAKEMICDVHGICTAAAEQGFDPIDVMGELGINPDVGFAIADAMASVKGYHTSLWGSRGIEDMTEADRIREAYNEGLRNPDGVPLELAFLDAGDKSSVRIVDGEAEYSINGLSNGLGLIVEEKFGAPGSYIFKDKFGNPVKRVTPRMVRTSPIGQLIELSLKNGVIDEKEANRQRNMFAALGTLVARNSQFAMTQAFIGSALFTAMKTNSDKQYSFTWDFVSICTKTQAVIDAMSAMMKKKHRGLTTEEILAIYQHTFTNDLPVPCPECYVFSRWVGIGSLLDNISTYQNAFKGLYEERNGKLFASEKAMQLYEEAKAEVDRVFEKKNADRREQIQKEIAKAKAEGASDDVIAELTASLNKQISKGKIKGDLANDAYKDVEAAESALAEAYQTNADQKTIDKLQSDLEEATLQWAKYKALTWIEDVFFKNTETGEVWSKRDKKTGKLVEDFSVPDDVLFDLNMGGVFAEDHPRAWAFRTTQGAGYGKAITPYAEARAGEGIEVIASNGGYIKGKQHGTKEGRNKFETLTKEGTFTKAALKDWASAMAKERVQAFLGGQRWQSTSDARPENALDYIMGALDTQAMGAYAQSYTKVSEAVRMFAALGLFPNQSLMPLGNGLEMNKDGTLKTDENGEYIPADSRVGGMDPDEARDNRRKYAGAGTITIGVNDQHIRAMFHQYWRDFIIPYHASGGNSALIAEFRSSQDPNIVNTRNQSSDYTKVQGEKVLTDFCLMYLYQEEKGLTEKEAREKIERVKRSRTVRSLLLQQKLTNQQFRIDQAQAAIDEARDSGRKVTKTMQNNLDKAINAQKQYKEYLEEYADVLLDKNNPAYNRFLVQLKERLEGPEWQGMDAITTSKFESQIYPNEYWDQTTTYETSGKVTQDYLDYCESLGMLHKFAGRIPGKAGGELRAKGYETVLKPVYGYDALGKKVPLEDLAYVYKDGKKTDQIETYFWKVLTDRQMYVAEGDHNGAYQPQRRVSLANVDARMVTEFAKPGEGKRAYDPITSARNAKEVENMSDAEIAQAASRYENTKLAQAVARSNKDAKKAPKKKSLVDSVLEQQDRSMKEAAGSQFSSRTLAQKDESAANYTPERLKFLFDYYGSRWNPHYAKAYVTRIDPSDFVALTATNPGSIEEQSADLPDDYAKNERLPMYLVFDQDTGAITGHEGRHRMVTLARQGIKNVPVLLLPDTSEGKENRTKIDALHLTGQQNSGVYSTAEINLHDVLPLSGEYRDEVTSKFASPANVNFSSRQLSPKQMAHRINVLEGMVDRREAAMQRYRAKVEKDMKAIRERNDVEKRREKIAQRATQMLTWLNNPTKKEHVPIPLQKHVAGILENINLNISAGGSKDSRAFLEAVRGLKDYYSTYAAGLKGKYDFTGFESTVPSAMISSLDTLEHFLEGSPRIGLMDSEALKAVQQVLGIVRKDVMKANKLMRNKRYQTVRELGKQTQEDAARIGERRILKYGKVFQELLSTKMMDAFSWAKSLGKGAESVIDALDKGMQQSYARIKEGSEWLHEQTKLFGVRKKDARKWSKAEVYYTTEDGHIITFTPAQIMSLYCASKRPQALNHILTGGIEIATNRKGHRQTDVYNLTQADLDAIFAKMTSKQRDMADAMQHYLSSDVAEWGNEVWRRMYDYEMFGEENYWPIKSAARGVKTQDPESTALMNAIANMGFTKATVTGASNPVTIEDAFDVFIGHVSQMARLNGLTEAVDDALKWYNWINTELQTETNENGKAVTKSVRSWNETTKSAIDKMMGPDGGRYFVKLLKDINGLSTGDSGTHLSSALLSKYKRAAVAGKLRVVIQQPTAIFRAWSMINPKYFANAYVGSIKKSINEMHEHSPLAWWKSQGNYDIGTGRSMRSIFLGSDNVLDDVTDVAMSPAGWADDFAWGWLWSAVKAETKEKHPELNPGSDAYWEYVNDRFSAIVNDTQVVDGVLQRSDLMRSTNGLDQMAAAFMFEPTKTYNMIRNRIIAMKHGGKKEVGEFFGTLISLLVSIAVNTAVRSAHDTFKKRNMGDEFGPAFMDNFQKIGLDDVYPWTYIPYIKDIASIVQGEDIERMDMSMIEDIWNAAKNGYKWLRDPDGVSGTGYKVLTDLVKVIGAGFGVPTTGLIDTSEVIINTVRPGTIMKKRYFDKDDRAVLREGGVPYREAYGVAAQYKTHAWDDKSASSNAEKGVYLGAAMERVGGTYSPKQVDALAAALGISYSSDKGSLESWTRAAAQKYLSDKEKEMNKGKITEEQYEAIEKRYGEHGDLLSMMGW